MPKPSPGIVIREKDQVVPDQSMSLEYILTRFTRNEALPISMPTFFGSDTAIDPESESEFNVDLEKSKYMDLTEKDDFRQRVNEVKAEFDAKQKKADEKAKADKAAKDKLAFEKRVRVEARKLAKKGPAETGSI